MIITFRKSALISLIILFIVILSIVILAADPTDAERKFFDVLKYRFNLHKDLADVSIDQAQGTMDNELVIKFACPNPPPKEGKIKIKTKLVKWGGGQGEAGFYEWKCSSGVDGNEKVMECENEISFDLDQLLPEGGLDGQTSNTGLYYHEWLHAQLLINAMNTADWQKSFCDCNVNWTPGDFDDPHTTIPGLQTNYTTKLLNRTVTSTNPWNNTGNESDRDGDGFGNDIDNCPDSFDKEQSNNDEDEEWDSCDEDDDNDNVNDNLDNCPLNSNNDQADFDNDNIGDVCDNCASDVNPEQNDFDEDGLGDVCDNDIDNDLINNFDDICPFDPFNDLDGDEVCGNDDNCPDVFNPDQSDTDNDNIGDVCDNDSDNDGMEDSGDFCAETILEPVSKGCSCFQILMLKPGPNHKERINGCSEKTINDFENGNGWTKRLFRH